MGAAILRFPGVTAFTTAHWQRRPSLLQLKVQALEDRSPGAATVVEQLVDAIEKELDAADHDGGAS
jgi:predicted alpha/beta hydrolase family esterase